MPRKSRKTLSFEPVVIETPIPEIEQSIQKTKAGGYIRISSDNPETDSLETQLLMIQQYVAEHPEYELVDTYVDPGFTGTNFDRPEFTRMIEDIKHGRIQCVIVKDLSRFGRNYIETGYFIETIFPQFNARLLAINDRFDSARESDMRGLRLPIKNMINSMYALDLSKKFADSFDLHSRLGDYKIRESTYGYILDRKNNTLIEDPESSGIVKLIYRWSLAGVSTPKIAQLLNMAEVEIPCQVKYRLDDKSPRNRYGEWGDAMVYRILHLPTYTGDMAFGRSRRRMYTKEHIRKTQREEWIIHPGTHTALVSHRDFEKVQAQTLQRPPTRTSIGNVKADSAKDSLANCFSRKVKCAECGFTMQYRRKSYRKQYVGAAGGEYVCTHDRLEGCGKKINEDLLKVLVFDQIKNLIKLVCDQKELAQDLLKGVKSKGTMLSLEKKKDYLRKKLPEVEEILTRLYVDFTEGVVREDEYKAFRNHYLAEKEELLGRLKELEDAEGTVRAKIRRFTELEKHFESILDSAAFDQTVIDELIERIYVGRDNEIEIRFKCEDVIAEFKETLEVKEDADECGGVYAPVPGGCGSGEG